MNLRAEGRGSFGSRTTAVLVNSEVSLSGNLRRFDKPASVPPAMVASISSSFCRRSPAASEARRFRIAEFISRPPPLAGWGRRGHDRRGRSVRLRTQIRPPTNATDVLIDRLRKRPHNIHQRGLRPDAKSEAFQVRGEVWRTCRDRDYAEVEPLFKRALVIAEKALGPVHPRVATSLNNLAILYLAQGRYAEAEPLLTRSLAIREKALGLPYSGCCLANSHPVFGWSGPNSCWPSSSALRAKRSASSCRPCWYSAVN